MRITYNTRQYPTVFVNITNEEDENNTFYEAFMTYLEDQYKQKKHFHIFVDLEELTVPNLKLVPDYIKRIKVLKERSRQYLDYYLIFNQNAWFNKLLYMLWNMCSPLGTAYLINDKQIALTLLENLSNPSCSKEFINAYVVINEIEMVDTDWNE